MWKKSSLWKRKTFIIPKYHVLVQISSVKDKHYNQGVVESEVDEEEEIKVMFYKTVNGTG